MAQIANWLGEMAAMLPQLMNGMAVTVQIFVVTLVFSLPLGLLVSFGRMAKNPVIRWITKAYISIMRGTPLMLQLFIVYFGPYYIFRIRVTNDYRLWAVFIGFVINYAPILRKSTAAASSPCRWGSTRRRSFWATIAFRRSSRSYSPR